MSKRQTVKVVKKPFNEAQFEYNICIDFGFPFDDDRYQITYLNNTIYCLIDSGDQIQLQSGRLLSMMKCIKECRNAYEYADYLKQMYRQGVIEGKE